MTHKKLVRMHERRTVHRNVEKSVLMILLSLHAKFKRFKTHFFASVEKQSNQTRELFMIWKNDKGNEICVCVAWHSPSCIKLLESSSPIVWILLKFLSQPFAFQLIALPASINLDFLDNLQWHLQLYPVQWNQSHALWKTILSRKR